jgi:excisionase family DNA binding protein
MDDDVLTTREVAAELGVSIRRVEALIHAGRLKARQAGRYWLVHRADLAAVRERKRTGRPRKAPAKKPRKKPGAGGKE